MAVPRAGAVGRRDAGQPVTGGARGCARAAARSAPQGLYYQRGAVEREFGRLKNEWGMLPLRVRRIFRVRLHGHLTILAKLASALLTPGPRRSPALDTETRPVQPISGPGTAA